MSKHTPGPWERSKKTDGNWWHIGAGNQAVAAVHAASKKRNEPYASMFEANANLIAAAPELLAALEEAVETIEWMNGCSSPARNEVEEAIREGRAAIAKAKGGAA
ncbi:hypothetical protein ACET9P_11135 [Aeromonas veronii]